MQEGTNLLRRLRPSPPVGHLSFQGRGSTLQGMISEGAGKRATIPTQYETAPAEETVHEVQPPGNHFLQVRRNLPDQRIKRPIRRRRYRHTLGAYRKWHDLHQVLEAIR